MVADITADNLEWTPFEAPTEMPESDIQHVVQFMINGYLIPQILTIPLVLSFQTSNVALHVS